MRQDKDQPHSQGCGLGMRQDKDLLFPMSMMTMFELECCLASSNHVVRCSNVSRLERQNQIQTLITNDVMIL